MTDKELYLINGGSSFNGTFLNALSRLINTLLDLGRAVGSSFRRARSGRAC